MLKLKLKLWIKYRNYLLSYYRSHRRNSCQLYSRNSQLENNYLAYSSRNRSFHDVKRKRRYEDIYQYGNRFMPSNSKVHSTINHVYHNDRCRGSLFSYDMDYRCSNSSQSNTKHPKLLDSVTDAGAVVKSESGIGSSGRRYVDLPLEFWERSDSCLQAKRAHMLRVDSLCDSRETLVLFTTLAHAPTVLERNMFPYDTPKGISHFTLWSIYDLTHAEIVEFVDRYLDKHYPHVRRWQYDDNSGDRSVQLFHVHVYIEFVPYSFTPHPDKLYLPDHMKSK
jgi:hypothetical protein